MWNKILSGMGGFAVWAGAAAAQVPIEDLARYPAVSNVSMSEDGSYLVGLMAPPENQENGQALAVWNLEDASGPLVTPGNDRMRFVAAQALKAGKLLAVGSQAWTGPAYGCLEGGKAGGSVSTFVSKVYITSTKMDEFNEPFQKTPGRNASPAAQRCFELTGQSSLYQNLPLDPHDVIVQRLNGSTFTSEYVRVDLKTGEETLLYEENSRDSAGLFDPRTGELLTLNRMNPLGDGEYEFVTLIRNDQTGEFEVHDKLTWTASDRHTVAIAGRDETTGEYYVITDLFSDNDAVYMYDPAARTFSEEPVFAHKRFNATNVWLDLTEQGQRLVGFEYTGPTSKVYFLDPEWNSIHAGLEQIYPDMDIDFIDYTDDLSKILYSVSSSTQSPVYYLLHDKQRTELVGASRPWIDPGNFRPTEFVYYEARDGLQIPALLTLPKGFEAGVDAPLPAVVMPHGGPWARDNADTGVEAWPPTQFLASRGYAVLQPQYRGSDGWSRSLWLAGDAEWGQKMQDDKDDGARWLVEQGIADPGRIAIAGFSYGGYAAMAATVRPGGPFRCAIAGAGVSNLDRLSRTWSENRLQRYLQGETVEGLDPIEHASEAHIPILVLHGDRDVRVPLFQGRDFYNAVKGHTDAKYKVIEDMPHGFPWPEHKEEFLTAIETYLANDCGMKPAS